MIGPEEFTTKILSFLRVSCLQRQPSDDILSEGCLCRHETLSNDKVFAVNSFDLL